MKKILCILICLFFMIEHVHAENYIVMSDDNRILFSENEHEPQSIASISKIMTAVICLEKGDYIDVWTVGSEVLSADEKRIYLKEGQQVSMRSLLYGLMLESGNDAAIVLAKRVGGTVERFVELMNNKAQELGMNHTVFHNPHGLDVYEDGNISTCYDMALLMNYALKNDVFCEIIKTLEYTSEWGSIFHNSNKLLTTFPFTLGGKTGYTSKAGRTLVSAARKDNLTLLCVSFQIHDHFNFHQTKYTEAMNLYQKMTLMKTGDYHWNQRVVHVDEEFAVTCSLNELSEAEIRYDYNESTGEFLVQFSLDDYVVHKAYSTSSSKNYCILGYCL